MAETITASMAGELLKKVSTPNKSNDKEITEKLNNLENSIDILKERSDPKSTEYLTDQNELINKFKKDIGFDDFSIKEQKAIIEEINKKTGSSYDLLMSITDVLNVQTSLLYKNLNKSILSTVTNFFGNGFRFSKSVVENMADVIKLKIQNMSPIKTLSSVLTSIKSSINSFGAKLASFSPIKSITKVLTDIKSSIISFGARLRAFNPLAKIADYFKSLFKPVMDSIKYIGQMFTLLIEFMMEAFFIIV